MKLAQLTAAAPRLALVGLAKNTGKTVTLTALLAELAARDTVVGVTSVGRDGEEHDVIDARIDKPRINLQEGSLVASTNALLRAGGAQHESLAQTGVRTPLGEVVIARLAEAGAVEVAGPSAAEDLRDVSDAMISLGAERVLIDGAIDRRAASSPAVADGLVMATGAVLSEDIDEVVARTVDAVALMRLPGLQESDSEGRVVRARAAALEDGVSAMLDDDEQLTPHPLPPRFALTAAPPVIADYLRSDSTPRWMLLSGAVPEAFLEGLIQFARRRGEPVKVLAADPTHVFLSKRGPAYYQTAGVELHVLSPIDLRAITVNPVAPQSHRFDSRRLRELIEEAIPGVPVLDVLHPD